MKESPRSRGRTGSETIMANVSEPPFADRSNKDTNSSIGTGRGHFLWFVHTRNRAEDRFITTHSDISHAAAKGRRGNYDSLLLFSHLRKLNFKQ